MSEAMSDRDASPPKVTKTKFLDVCLLVYVSS